MALNLLSFSSLYNLAIYFSQVVVPGQPPTQPTAENAALVFSGPQFFSALIAGVVLAFAFQLLLTNLGVAAGISLLGKSSSSHHEEKEPDSFGRTIRKVGTTLGLGTLISVTLALFFACLLAVKLSLFVSPASGAIVGLVIWATFFSAMMWLSSTAVGSLLGSIFSTATSGLQAIFGTATAALGAKAANQQIINTAEAAVAAVKRELGAGIDPITMRENVEELLQSIKTPELDLEKISADFERLLKEEDLREVVNSESLRNIDRNTFTQLISDRSNLSKRDVERIASKLESIWQKATNQQPSSSSNNKLGDFANYLKSATKEQLLGSDLSSKLDSLIDEMRKDRENQGVNPTAQTTTLGLNSLMGMILGRTDLSDFDVDKIVAKLQNFKESFSEQTDKVVTQVGIKDSQSRSTIKTDIENYLLNAYPWQLKQKYLDVEFRDLIYDPNADPEMVAVELRRINRGYFVDLLKQKGLYTQTQIESIANLLEAIRLEVIHTAEGASEREKMLALLAEVESYLVNTPKSELTPEKIQLNLKPALEDFDASYEQLGNRLNQLDRPTLERMVELRGDLDEVEKFRTIQEIELIRDRILQESQTNLSQATSLADQQWLKVQSYLRDTGKSELNPQAIEAELKLLLEDPQAGANALKTRLAQFDRDTLVQLLSQRQDLNQQQVEDIIDSVENVWFSIQTAPQKLTAKAQQQYEEATSAIANYLRNTGKAELNPEGIKQDLTLLLDNPQLGAKAIRQRLAAMDRDTLVQLLSQRKDLNEAEVNRAIDEVQFTLRTLAKAPRRLAIRTQAQVQDFQSAIANYLRSTDKEELNPEGIKRDIELLLNDPRAGAESLQSRLAKFDRDTLVALLSQRNDMSQEDVNRTIDQILSVRDRILAQLQTIQNQVQSVIDRVLAKIRTYLDSLERPELAYEGIKHDLQTLFHDPQAGFEALKDRFSQLDRDTLIAVLSSRDDISQADAERLVFQVERTRDRILQRAERIQTEAQLRLEAAKVEVQKQAEETRKAAATASWWLFFTALISAIASAGAGALGVID
ncbi:hypothetical protein Sta7437_3614 [Stanieria cyanosphaera PCC 7437]|uniref:Uncharacterized protein n=1 Tax=Stanieria cyanosphaera (strain ATCC 29371 / PCC 7437) TaxID=111780 RepID=K9XZM6_STAC7|nr:hypothetical protein [Stanieria cyanosphaera]AFZ37112.1 hypothetical protein Sta7437_3614 [Stanieria cyanosphaera PCC 7437]